MDPVSTSPVSCHDAARSVRRPRSWAPWAPWARGAFLVLGSAASVAIGYAAMVTVLIAAVMFDAAPLGLSGEQQSTEPWVDPAAFGAGVVVFLVGIRLTVRTFRRHGARRVPPSSLGS